jgi:hypothetical protein
MYAQRIGDKWRELAGAVQFSETVFQTAESLSDEQRNEFQVYFIEDAVRETLSAAQKYGDPIFTVKGDIVERAYPVLNKTEEEIQQSLDNKIIEVRWSRAQKLKDSDWTQLQDATADKDAWAVYRQALRDISKQEGYPWDVTWPKEP